MHPPARETGDSHCLETPFLHVPTFYSLESGFSIASRNKVLDSGHGNRLWLLSCSQSLGWVLLRLFRTSLKSLRCLYTNRFASSAHSMGRGAGGRPLEPFLGAAPRGPLRQSVVLGVLQNLTSQKKQTYKAKELGSLCRMQKYNRGRRNHQRQWP